MSAMSRRRALLLGAGKPKNKNTKPAEPEKDVSRDIGDVLDLFGVSDTAKRSSTKRKADEDVRRMTPVFKKMKLSHPDNWVFPLPQSFMDFLMKFNAVETAFCTFVARDKNPVSFDELALQVRAICRKHLTKTDILRVEALTNFYRVKNVTLRIQGGSDSVLGVVLLNPENVPMPAILTQGTRKQRRKFFRAQLEEVVVEQHSDYLARIDAKLGYEDVRERQKFHPRFNLDRDVKLTCITTKALPKLKTKAAKRRRMLQAVIKEGKGTRLDSDFIKEKLSKELTQAEMMGASSRVRNALKGKGVKKRLSTGSRQRVTNGAHPSLRHLSPTLLIKIQGKQKIKQTLKENPEVALRKKRLEDAIYLTDLIKSIFNSCRKISMPFEELIRRVATQHKRFPNRDEIRKRLLLLTQVVPEFCTLRKCVTMEIFCYHKRTTIFRVHEKLKREVGKVDDEVSELSSDH